MSCRGGLLKPDTTRWLELSFRRVQGQQSDFGRTIQAHRNPDGAQAGAGVERERTYLVGAPDIFLTQGWKVKRREQWNSDLTSVRVSRKLQVDWKMRGFIGEVGFMRKQNNGFAGGNAAQRLGEVGGVAENVIHAGQPKARAVSLDWLRLVRQNLNVLGLERAGHVFGVGGVVVVSEDGPEAVRGSDLAQETGTGFGCERCSSCVTENWESDKIPSKYDQIGMKGVHHWNGGEQGMDREIRVVVEIADEGDGETIKSQRPARQQKVPAHNARTIRREEDGIAGDRNCAGGCGAAKKLASCRGNKRQTKITLQALKACACVLLG
jgi:hypothetical protein